MNILVCISNVPDTTTRIKLSGEKDIDRSGIQWIINPWDELALTRALELKEEGKLGIQKITVAGVGDASIEPTLRKALAVGADNAVRVDAVPLDSASTAAHLTKAFATDSFQLVICGIESSDYNGTAVGGMLAEMLNLPSVSGVSGLQANDGNVEVTREIDGGKQVVRVNGPFVAIVQKGIAINPRIPAMRGIMQARTKPLQVIPGESADVLAEIARFSMPPAKKACHMVDPADIQELVRLLHEEARVI